MADREELKISVVDADLKHARTVKNFLEDKFEAEVTISESASEFLFHLEQTPDVVIMEYNIPDLRGDKLLKSIQEYNSKIKVIILSNQTDSKVARYLIQQDIYEYIVKTNNSLNVLEASVQQIWDDKMRFRHMMNKAFEKRNEIMDRFKGIVKDSVLSRFKS